MPQIESIELENRYASTPIFRHELSRGSIQQIRTPIGILSLSKPCQQKIVCYKHNHFDLCSKVDIYCFLLVSRHKIRLFAAIEVSVLLQYQFQVKSIKSCYLRHTPIMMKTLQRVVMLYNAPDQQHELAPLCMFWKQPKNAIQAEETIPGLWYLRLFKDVAVSDIDMLLPGSEVQFTWFDHLMIWIPVLVGLISAVWKCFQGTLNFSNSANALTSLGLVGMPLTWAVKAYFKIKEKETTYHAHLTQLLSLHNLANNSGVLSTLLDEATDQENNEALLAFFFLWQGQNEPKPIHKAKLDKDIEKFLNQFMIDNKLRSRIDFDVDDAVNKLEKMGLVNRVRDEDGSNALRVVNLKEGMAMLQQYNLDEKERDVSEWMECFAAYPPTGQRIRYFWNQGTKESTYRVPHTYTAALK